MADTVTVSEEANVKEKRVMTPEHKEALAQGRQQGQKVRAYLGAIESAKPKRGRRVTKETLQERLANITKRLAEEDLDPAARVILVQERLTIDSRLSATESENMLEELEKEFVEYAKPWAETRGVTYAAFREVGVEPRVLKAAGLERRAS